MLRPVVKHACFLLALGMLAAPAHASYGQMRLDGLGLLLALALTVAYGVIVDVALITRIFRHRAAMIIGSILGLAVVLIFLGLAASPGEQAGFFKGAPGGSALVILVVTSAVFLPFIVIAPFAQYLSMCHGGRSPGWITAWMILQLALPPGFIVLAVTDRYFWNQEYAEGQAEGSQARAGEMSVLLERAEQRHERIWGTGWTYPWLQKPVAGSFPRSSGWILGLAKSIDASALIAANEPLSEPDRTALQALMERHFVIYAVPHIRARLLWDTLEPGEFSRLLWGPHEPGDFSGTIPRVSEEEIPVLLERLEKQGEARFCPGGRMLDADRAALNALIQKMGRIWISEKRDYEMRPDWASYQRRVDELCSGPG